MKLEEVLPAMREGRVAVDSTGYKWRCIDGAMRFLFLGSWQDYECPPIDGWTLEPEPKVEWPKGSLQWACLQAGERGSIRRKGWNGSMRVDGCMKAFTAESLSLDWEVVP